MLCPNWGFRPAKRRKHVPVASLEEAEETTALSWAGSGYNKKGQVDVDLAATYSSGSGATGSAATTLHGVPAPEDDDGDFDSGSLSAPEGSVDGGSELGSELGSETGSDDSASVRSDQPDDVHSDGEEEER